MLGFRCLRCAASHRSLSVSSLRFLKLFWRLFGPARKLDTREIESMGLLAVKIAQMYAVRSDLLGIEKCRELQRLYEEVTPLPAHQHIYGRMWWPEAVFMPVVVRAY